MARVVPGIPEHLAVRQQRYTAAELGRLRRICRDRSIDRKQLAVLLLTSANAADVEAALTAVPAPARREHW